MLAVAQANETFFNPTETFLYNYLVSFRRILPVGIAFRVTQDEAFPYPHPLIQVYTWNYFSRKWRGARWHIQKLCGSHYSMDFARKSTFDTIRKYDVRLLHGHFGYTGCRLLRVKQKSGLPVITTFYGCDMSALPEQKIWQDAYARLFREGDLFLVEGPHMRQQLIKLGAPPEKTAIQRIALRLPCYPFRLRAPKGSGQVYTILFCGRFSEKKGILYALEAVKKTYERCSRLEFRIIGDGELRPQIEEMIESYQMQPYTQMLGFQPHESMIEEMKRADIFLHPSVTAQNGDSEGGAPTTILEAQACGLPVVSTTHADIPNVVIAGQSALLAPERDSETLCEHLLLLLQEPERLATLGNAGRAFVEKKHDINTEVQLLEDRYYSLAS